MGSVKETHPLLADLFKRPDLEVLTASSTGWTDVRATYIIDNPARPLAIARPKNASEVSAFVQAARRHGVKISVRAGGHDTFGRSIAEGCLVIDMRKMKTIEIAQDCKTATLGGGVLIGEVIETLASRKLTTPFGYFPTIGYAGWAMMGGYGWLAPRFGLGVDQILRARVVTWQGDIIEADGELLKGIRGAGGNFGIVVELGIKIYPFEKASFLSGTILFHTAEIRETARKYFSGYNAMTKSPYGAVSPFWYPKQDMSGWTFAINFAWSSPDMEAGRQYLEQLAALAEGADTSLVKEMTPIELINLIISWTPNRAYGYEGCNAVSFARITERAADVVGEFLSKVPVDSANLLLIHEMRGTSAEPDPGSCFGARLPHSVMELVGVAVNPDNVRASKQRFRELYDALHGTGDALGVTYASLTQTRDTNIRGLFGKEYPFVMELKNKYDPEGVFDNTEPRLRP
ncbi:uncharacterized protein Z520_06960 [Fonsecaea multimorphosa CBS 102226]|uniref:FAD-binding PCMH-type domain-containing protein n=1 Tax=Fonsecaea multimorphosa CBS 102226 TaxID=1442371 RepID=A0A0D2KLH9_9EURO|nr:uncharacterized protein Z520_06960 [Fonsecaea multimorphosa CBS 102226]KIX97508.1 hypothetical protein Z520_06960 [Fonsecaea multimorphosa CBS 102226]OAL23470.1 hypothetical protein AYO22_06520 [Fonsecaea multimorphosa]